MAWAVRRNFLDGRGFQPTASLDGRDHDRGEPNEEGHTGVSPSCGRAACTGVFERLR